MAALDFPSGATVGDIYTGTNNVIYQFDGVKWQGLASTLDLGSVVQDIVPDVNNVRKLGSPTKQWADVFVSTGSIYIGNVKLSNQAGKLVTTTVVNPGEETEEPDPEDSDASSEIRTVNELVNNEHSFKLEDDGTLTLDGDTYSPGGGSGTITSDGTFSTLPSFLDFYANTGLRTGQSADGVFFSGNATNEGSSVSYPIRTNFSIEGNIKVTVTLDMVVNDECSDFGLCVFEDGTEPEWQWGSNATRIAAQYNCENPEINGLNGSSGSEYALPGNGMYRVRFTYDPANTPNVTLETLDTNNTILDTITYNETLNTSNNYRVGFAADQDDGRYRTYIRNLTIAIDGGDTYTDSLQLSAGGGADLGYLSVENYTLVDRDETNNFVSVAQGNDHLRIGTAGEKSVYITTNHGSAQPFSTPQVGAKTWEFGSNGGLVFPDGSVQTTAYLSGQQYGYINQYVHSTNDNVDLEAVAMDSDGNSYISYGYYDDNEGKSIGGIFKLDSTGNTVWHNNLTSQSANPQYSKIASLEHVEVDGTKYLVAIGTYYDNDLSKDRGFMWFINPDDGSAGTQFDTESGSEVTVSLHDAVFGLDGSNQAFAVMVGYTYDEVQQKTFTPLAGSGLNKLVVSWSDWNASGMIAGEYIYYTTGGNFQMRMNAFDTVASLSGTGDGLYLTVFHNSDGTYSIKSANGWSGVIGSWGNPVNVRVLGSNLGGADGVNDLTFDLDVTALYANSNNVAGWSSNLTGTAVGDVIGLGYGDKDYSTDVGNQLTFDYQLNRQAYLARLGANSWARSIGASEYEQLNTVVVDNVGNSYVGGYYWTGNKASLVAKFDIDGNQLWAVHIDSPNDTGNSVNSIDILSDDNLITVDENGIVTKLDKDDGSIIWQVKVDPNDDISWDSDFRGTATPDGNYIFSNYEDNDYTFYVLCVSGTDGSEVWSKRIRRSWGGNNGEIYPQDDFDAQFLDSNSTSVTLAASTYLYLNGNSTYAGLVINLPIDGENVDGTYDQYLIETVNPGYNTENTTATSVDIVINGSPVSLGPASPSTATNSFSVTENIIGTVVGGLGDITFNGSKLSSPATNAGDFPNGVITLAPGDVTDNYYANNGQFINIYPTNAYDSPHIHIAPGSGSGGTGDLILGVDNYHIDVNHNGSIYVRTNNQNHSWEFDTSGNLRLPSGGDILDSSGDSVLGGGGLPRGSVGNNYDPDLTVGIIRVMMNNGVITVRHANGDGLALIYSGRTVSASGSTTILSTGATSVNAGDAHTLATLANRGDSMVLDYIYDANTNDVYRVTVFVSWSSLPYGSIVIEQIA